MNKISRGPHAGLSARTVQELLGSSYYMAKKKLKLLKQEVEIITLEDIGKLIHEFRQNKDNPPESNLDKLFKRLLW